jgi:RNA polymerase sigma-70 factor, ECF subfamily
MKAGDTALAELAGAWPIGGEDAEIVAGLCEGSETAFEWLVGRYQNSVYSLVYQILQDRNDAPDTVQEVFLKVYRGIRRFRGECSLKTWIYRIAVHEASNQRRWWSRHRRQELSLETPLSLSDEGGELTLGHTLRDMADSPLQERMNSEMREVVQRALAELPVIYRTVLLLRDVEDLSYEEMAEVLQVRVGTVKSRLARAREALRPLLAPYLEQPEAPETAGAGERSGAARDKTGAVPVRAGAAGAGVVRENRAAMPALREPL